MYYISDLFRRCAEDDTKVSECENVQNLKIKMPDECVDLKLLWESRLGKRFNVFTVGKIFR